MCELTRPPVDGDVGADRLALHERLHQPKGRWRGVDLVHLQRTGQRAGVGQAADPTAREGAAGEVPLEATCSSRSS
jgi:hypothetical protein